MADNQLKASITTAGEDVRKADTKALITGTMEGFPEDSFFGQYYIAEGFKGSIAIIAPQFHPGMLYSLIAQNNTLAQCVEAMEVNIDGMGHSIDLIEGEKENEKERQALVDFFDEPYPNKSMQEIRRALRRDIETTGNGYLEVIRNINDDVLMLNHRDSIITRLLMLDDAVETEKTLVRGGSELTVKMEVRERRFVQEVNGKKTFFKQFGATRDLDRETGLWAAVGTRLPIDKRASELIHMVGNHEPKTPYGSPRWINQLPSILGSRKAEEHNLEFFDAGGLPPVLIIIQGGTLGDTVKDELQAHLSGKGVKHRAAIVEATSTSGTLDAAGNVQVKVERFGCVDEQTEVLTSRGWLSIRDWTNEQVATLVDGSLVYQDPLQYHSYDFSGDLIHIEGAATEFMVTPTHRVWYQQPRDRTMRFEFASHSVTRSNLIVPVAPPKGMSAEFFLSFLVADKLYTQDTWLDFLGMFIADGSTNGHESNPNTITITVKKSRKKEFIQTFMSQVAMEAKGSYSANDYEDRYTKYSIYDSSLRNWLREKVGSKAVEKRIPPQFLQLGQVQSERLLQAMLQGDGHFNGEDSRCGWTYTTVSPQLADDVQILALHAGYRSVLSKVKDREEYCISLTPKTMAHVTSGKCPSWGLVPYTGKVYCFTMPTGVFITRRNGKVCITGNSERQQDAMFQTYDANCEEHVRTSFRLPPLFVGKSREYSFATAYTSYLVAEAQVFWPEREEFDALVNSSICRALGAKSYRFRSLPLTMVDITNQLAALGMVAGKAISGEELVSKLNEIVGLGMQYEKQEAPVTPPVQTGLPSLGSTGAPGEQAGGTKLGTTQITPTIKKEDVDASSQAILNHYWGVPGVEELCRCADHLINAE